MQVHVLPVDWSSYSDALAGIRQRVFVEEQGVPEAIEHDGQDAAAQHFLAITEAGQHVGCARLLPDGQIGRMAVLPDFRSRGIGARLLAAAVEQAGKNGHTRLYLNAQTDAISLYRRAGFLASGAEFMEAGLPHQRMEMNLPIPFEAPGDVARPVLREENVHPDAQSAQLHRHDGEHACQQGLAGVLDHPLREVRIYSALLDHTLFEDDAVLDALSRFARGGPPTTVQILIHSSDLIISRGHRLLDLARRLTSKIQIRVVAAELQDDRRCYVLADQRAFFLMPDDHEYQGFSNAYDPVQSSQLAERFDYLWQRAEQDPELRALNL